MPCYSRIVSTKMTDKNRIIDAMKAHGIIAKANGDFIYGTSPTGNSMSFRRAGTAYSFDGDSSVLSRIAKKYAEIGVREFAKRRGFGITESDGTTMTIVNRRER